MVRRWAVELVAATLVVATGCGDSQSSVRATPTALATASFTPTSTGTPTAGFSPTPSPTSCVGVAPSVEPIDSPTTRSVVTVRGTGVTCGANKRVIIDGPHDEFIIEDCTNNGGFEVQVRLDLGVNAISVCQFSLCASVCTDLQVERRRG